MPSDSFDLNIDQGAEYTVTFTYCAPSEITPSEPGTPIDVTGWTALSQFRDSPGQRVLLELTDVAGITVGTTDGTFAVQISDDQTSGFGFRRCVYDLFVTPPEGEAIRLVGGEVFVRPAVSVAQ